MDQFYQQLDQLFQEGDLSKIEHFLIGSMEDLRARGEQAYPELAAVMNELAGFYRGISRYAESERYFMESFALLEKMGMGKSVSAATVLLNNAGNCRLSGRYDEALKFFLQAKEILEEIGQTTDYAYTSLLNNIALVYQELGEHEKALQYSEQALAVMRRYSAAEHEIATTLNNMAAIRISMGQLDEAQRLIDEALAIYDGMPQLNVHHAAALGTQAMLWFFRKEYARAIEAYLKSLEMTRHFFGDNMESAMIHQNLARVYLSAGEQENALRVQKDAVAIMERLLDDSHPALQAARRTLEEISIK